MQTTPGRFLLSCVVYLVLAAGVAAQTMTPLRIRQTVEPQFPPALAHSTLTRGQAHVVINVDADGKLADWLVTGYTDKAFADEAVSVLKLWHYTPATEGGRPVGVRKELRFDFEARGRVVSLMAIETPEVLYNQAMGGPALISYVCPLQELDRPLAPVNPASPSYPGHAGPSAQPRTVRLDFYVDEKGQPRMPVVIDAAHQSFAEAAVDALSRWRFPAPTRGGKPVAVRVQQEFIFPGSS
jgi:TonB family protein